MMTCCFGLTASEERNLSILRYPSSFFSAARRAESDWLAPGLTSASEGATCGAMAASFATLPTIAV